MLPRDQMYSKCAGAVGAYRTALHAASILGGAYDPLDQLLGEWGWGSLGPTITSGNEGLGCPPGDPKMSGRPETRGEWPLTPLQTVQLPPPKANHLRCPSGRSEG